MRTRDAETHNCFCFFNVELKSKWRIQGWRGSVRDVSLVPQTDERGLVRSDDGAVR